MPSKFHKTCCHFCKDNVPTNVNILSNFIKHVVNNYVVVDLEHKNCCKLLDFVVIKFVVTLVILLSYKFFLSIHGIFRLYYHIKKRLYYHIYIFLRGMIDWTYSKLYLLIDSKFSFKFSFTSDYKKYIFTMRVYFDCSSSLI